MASFPWQHNTQSGPSSSVMSFLARPAMTSLPDDVMGQRCFRGNAISWATLYRRNGGLGGRRFHSDATQARRKSEVPRGRAQAPTRADGRAGSRSIRSVLGASGLTRRSAAPPGPRPTASGTVTMSTAMNFGTKSFTPRPPDKGAFPLDHFGECKGFKEKFMKCLRENSFENALCRQESKEYLECRMERQLMAKEPMEKLGFKDLIDEKSEAEHNKL